MYRLLQVLFPNDPINNLGLGDLKPNRNLAGLFVHLALGYLSKGSFLVPPVTLYLLISP